MKSGAKFAMSCKDFFAMFVAWQTREHKLRYFDGPVARDEIRTSGEAPQPADWSGAQTLFDGALPAAASCAAAR